MPAREGVQRAHLIQHVMRQVLGRGGNVAAAEALQVAEPGMRPDADAARRGFPHRAVHQARVAGVEARGDVGGADQRQQRLVAGLANGPSAETLAHVAVDIDGQACGHR